MINIGVLIAFQDDAVARWHGELCEPSSVGFEALVQLNHEINFRLWHEEDQARDPVATDTMIAGVKRRIDRLNQQRSDSVEQIDNAIADQLHQQGVIVSELTPLNTETAGSAIDRLSILSLRIYHLAEQSARPEVSQDQRQRVHRSHQIALQQRSLLAISLQQLIDDLFSGRKRHVTFRQLKMYNDPQLNPAIYGRREQG